MALSNDEVLSGLRRLTLDGEATGVRLLGSGFETDVFAFDLVRDGSIERRVLRVYLGDETRDKARREFDAMASLRKAGYPAPEVFELDTSDVPFGGPFLTMERIDGCSLESLYQTADEDARAALMSVHGRLMAELHRIDPATLSLTSVDELAELERLADKLGEHLPGALREVLEWLHLCFVGVEIVPAVVHGDFHRNNILMRDGKTPFVIDWSNVRLSDYRVDVAWMRLILRLIEAITGKPCGAEQFVTCYESFAERRIDHLRLFDVLTATRLLLSVMCSLRFGPGSQGMRPEIVDRMRADVEGTIEVSLLAERDSGIPLGDVRAELRYLANRGTLDRRAP